MLYSIIIATYNRAALLQKCLEALVKQSVNNNTYEIIVIDDGSTDNTKTILEEFAVSNKNLNFTYLTQKNRGVASARNAGINRANGEIVFFTDDDCVVPPNWIATLANGFQRHPDVAGVGGWYEYPAEWHAQKLFVRYYKELFSRTYGDTTITQEIKNNSFSKNPAGNTSNMSYKKDILNGVGGFDGKIDFVGLVDWELKKRLADGGYSLLYIPYNVIHLKPLGIKDVAKKFINIGRGGYYLSKKHPDAFLKYYPAFWKYFYRMKAFRGSMRLMALVDFLFTRIGWEYQKQSDLTQ